MVLDCTLVFIDADGHGHNRQRALCWWAELGARQVIIVGQAGGNGPTASDTTHLEQIYTDQPLSGSVCHPSMIQPMRWSVAATPYFSATGNREQTDEPKGI